METKTTRSNVMKSILLCSTMLGFATVGTAVTHADVVSVAPVTTDTTTPTTDVTPVTPAPSTGADTGTSTPTTDVTPVTPTDGTDTGTTPPSTDTGTTPPSTDTGTTPPSTDTGTTPTDGTDTGTTPPSTDTGTTPPSTDTGTTPPSNPERPVTTPTVDNPIVTDNGSEIVSTVDGQVVIKDNETGATKTVAPETIGAKVNNDGTIEVKDKEGNVKTLPKTGTKALINNVLSILGMIVMALGMFYVKPSKDNSYQIYY